MAMVRRDYQKQGVLRALIDLVRKKVSGIRYHSKYITNVNGSWQAEDAGEYLATCTTNDDNVSLSSEAMIEDS